MVVIERGPRQLGPGAHAERPEDSSEVGLDRVDAHEQRGRDLAIGVPRGGELGDSPLRVRQRRPGRPSTRDTSQLRLRSIDPDLRTQARERPESGLERLAGGGLLARSPEDLSEREHGPGGPERHLQTSMEPDRFLGGFHGCGILTLRGQDERTSPDHLADGGRDAPTTRATFDRIEDVPRLVLPPEAEECLSLVGDDQLPADRNELGGP